MKFFVFRSPYKRTRQTCEACLESIAEAGENDVEIVSVAEDPRIREREFVGSFEKEDVMCYILYFVVM